MAEFRTVKTRIWDDEWFSLQETDAKLYWLYLITNHRASVAGIYLLRQEIAAVESGLPLTRVQELEAAFERDGKLYREGMVVWVVKLRDYQETQSETVRKRIASDIKIIPDCELKTRYLIHYRYPIDTLAMPSGGGIPQLSPEKEREKDTEREKERETRARALGPLPLAVKTYLDSLAIGETTSEAKRRRMVSLALRWEGKEQGQDGIPGYSDASAALVISHWCKTQLHAYQQREGAGRFPGLSYFESMIREYCATGRLPGERNSGNGSGTSETEDLDAYCRELARKQAEHPERFGFPRRRH